MHLYLNTDQAASLIHVDGYSQQYFRAPLISLFDTLGFYSPADPGMLIPPAMLAHHGVLHNPINMHRLEPSPFLVMPSEEMQVTIQDEMTGQFRAFVLTRTGPAYGSFPMIFIPWSTPTIQANLAVVFDNELRIIRFNLTTQGYYHQDELQMMKQGMRECMLDIVPIASALLYAWNTRGREQITLNPPKPMQARGQISNASTLTLGPVKQITNPRDNPTDIVRSPHLRSGHWREYQDGTKIWIDEIIVRKDEFIADQHGMKVLK